MSKDSSPFSSRDFGESRHNFIGKYAHNDIILLRFNDDTQIDRRPI